MPTDKELQAQGIMTQKSPLKQKELGISGRVGDYLSPDLKGGFSLSGTPKEREGALSGLEISKTGYGQNLFDVGSDIQRVKELQRARTEGSDPVSEAIRASKAGAQASAQRQLASSGVKGGAASGAVAEIGRQKDADIAASLYGQQRQNIADERSLASNMLSGTTSMLFGGRGEGNAGNMSNFPGMEGLFGDSVICTELFHQGLMDKETYKKDSAYGNSLNIEIIVGYQFWAVPVVKLMKKSPRFTKLIKVPALKWAKHISGEESSLFGYVCQLMGEPLCGLLGKIVLKFIGEKYAC